MKTNTAYTTARTGRRRVLLAMSWTGHSQMDGICRYAAKAGWIFRYWNGEDLEGTRHFNPQGVICQFHRAADPQMIVNVHALHLPKVDMYNFGWPPQLSRKYDFRTPRTMPAVYVDTRASGAMAAEHLFNRGFTRLVYVGRGPDDTIYHGYKQAADALRCELVSIFNTAKDIQCKFDENQSRIIFFHDELSLKRQKWASHVFATLTMPVGVFVDNQVWASDIIDGCLAAGIFVPEQVGLIATVDDEHQGSCYTVPATVIVPDHEEHGYQAAALLDRMMNGENVSPDTCIMIPPKRIVQRDSTLVHASSDLGIARATSYILRNLHRNSLSAIQVCARAGTSTSSLYRSFARHMGMSIADYIEHLRIKDATSLLATTDLTATVIAERCGFTDLRHFRHALERVEGKSPTAYREEHRKAAVARK